MLGTVLSIRAIRPKRGPLNKRKREFIKEILMDLIIYYNTYGRRVLNFFKFNGHERFHCNRALPLKSVYKSNIRKVDC
jgi:hypothetical protein